MSTNLTKTGILNIVQQENKCLINNFTQTGIETGWSFGTHTFTNGIIQLTGAAPNIQSNSFSVGSNDIIVFEFIISLPTPSTTTSGPGLYLGTKYGDSTTVYYYNNGWVNNGTTTNAYFIHSYNSTAINSIRTFILGSTVDINDVPLPTYSSTNTHTIYALKVPNTTTYIRSGYNSNTSMVINFYNPRIYKINYNGFCENDSDKKLSLGYASFQQFIEY